MADGDDVICRTRVSRGVYNTLFNRQQQARNELFQPGRMAYLVELESLKGNPLAAPTTVIRSKADCPEVDGSGSKASTSPGHGRYKVESPPWDQDPRAPRMAG